MELLSDDERTRAARFHFHKDALKFVAARASMRSILAECTHVAAREVRFLYAKHGKPSLADNPADIRFNLSHAGDRAILGVTLERDVGVDIEVIRRDLEFEKLAERFFSLHERACLRELSAEKKMQFFFRVWTCKEAFLKAQGFGLTRSLDSFDIDLSSGAARLLATRPDPTEARDWSIVELETSPAYAAAMAVEGRVNALRVFRYE
jgi:4'-phosphopantetheinyl transferase